MALRQQRLVWRTVVPFAAYVVLGSLALAMVWETEARHRSQEGFERLAETNVRFLTHARLTPSAGLLEKLGGILGCEIFLRGVDSSGGKAEFPALDLTSIPADGKVRSAKGGWEVLALAAGEGADLVFVRKTESWIAAFGGVSIWASFLLFWLLSFLLGWVMYQRVVFPIRDLTSSVRGPGSGTIPHIDRADEIGELARSFARDRERLESERVARERAERLALLGKMGASLAHEIHNPLSAVRMHADLLETKVGPAEIASVGWIRKCSERIGSIVNRWRYLASPEPGGIAEVGLGEVVREALAGVPPEERSSMYLDEAGGGMGGLDGLVVRGDRRRLEEAVANLVRNAQEAGAKHLWLGGMADADHVMLRVEDDGPGFSDEALIRGTEIFFTDKQGGLALA